MMDFNELDAWITKHIQGNFNEFEVMKPEIEKLEPGDIYLEVGTDEGKSFRVVHEYAKEGVFKFAIDIHDVVPHAKSVGRAPFMEQEGIVGIGKTGFYIHGDADQVAYALKPFLKPFIKLLLLDPHHDYESIKENTLNWEPLVLPGGVMLFHDYDHPETKRWLDEHYGDNKELLHGGKIVKVTK